MVSIPNEVQWISMPIIFTRKCSTEKLSQKYRKIYRKMPVPGSTRCQHPPISSRCQSRKAIFVTDQYFEMSIKAGEIDIYEYTLDKYE